MSYENKSSIYKKETCSRVVIDKVLFSLKIEICIRETFEKETIEMQIKKEIFGYALSAF